MGLILGIISTILILSAIYFRVDGKKNISKILFITGIIGALFFVATMIRAILE